MQAPPEALKRAPTGDEQVGVSGLSARGTQSLCPECLRVIDATIHEAEGQVFMHKRCPTHGAYDELVSSDAKFYGLMLARDRSARAAIENLYAAGIHTILVPTIVKGINDDQLGRILAFAIEHSEEVCGVSWQPVAFTGRLDYAQRLAQRFTVADLAREIQRQTGLVDMYRDWYPFCSYNSGPCHRRRVEKRLAVPLSQYRAASSPGRA